MNGYDDQALNAIKCYHARHGEYPRFVEATAEHMEKMDCTEFVLLEPNEQGTSLAVVESSVAVSDAIRVQQTSIPVVPLGTGDIVFRGILVRNTDINLEIAECATIEQFHRIGAKFARAGCLLMGEKSSWGCVTYNPHLFFSQIEAFVFGEQAILEEVMPKNFNHSSES